MRSRPFRRIRCRSDRPADLQRDAARIPRPPVGSSGSNLWQRLKAVLPGLNPALDRHGHPAINPIVRQRAPSASPATVDRLLASSRVAGVNLLLG